MQNTDPVPHTASEDAVPLPRRLLRLALSIGVLLFIMHVVTPFVTSFGPMKRYAEVVDETGITPGVLFYSDVAQTNDGEFNNRDAIRFRTTTR